MGSVTYVDNSLIMNVSNFLSKPQNCITKIDTANFQTFVHAVVLFDKVFIPIAPNQKKRVEDELSASLSSQRIFKSFTLKNFEKKKKSAIKQSIKFARDNCKNLLNHDAEYLIALFDAKSEAAGPIWKTDFDNHLERYNPDSNPYMKEAQNRINANMNCKYFDSLPFHDKLKIEFVWRSVLHTYLALGSGRPYLHNFYRTPFVNIVYNYIDKNVLLQMKMENSFVEVNE